MADEDALVEKLSENFKEIVNQAREEGAKSREGEFLALREEVAHLTSLIEGDPDKAKDQTFIYRHAEKLEESFQRTQKRLKESFNINVSERAFILGGGMSHVTAEEDKYFQMAARDKVRYSPHIRNIYNLMRSAIFVAPVKVDIPHEQTDTVINKILSKNKFNKTLRGWGSNCLVDGEVFIVLYIDLVGNMKFREVDPQEVNEIEYHPKDQHVTFCFIREIVNTEDDMRTSKIYYREADYEENVNGDYKSNFEANFEEGKLMFHFRYGFRDGKRGEIPFLPIMRYDRIYEDTLIDLARLYHERAKVVWIKRLYGSNQQLGGWSRSDLPVKGGVVKIETDTVRWRIENSRLSEHTSREYGRVHRLAISAGVGVPEAFVSSDSSSSSYASLRQMNSPFYLTITDNQTFWRENLEDFIRVMMRELVKKEVLPEEVEIERVPQDKVVEVLAEIKRMDKEGYDRGVVEKLVESCQEKETVTIPTEELPVTIIFSRQMIDNPLQNAQALEVLRRAGIISQRTAMKHAGLDPEVEMALMKYEIPLTPVNITKNKNQTRSQPPDDNYNKKLGRNTA